MAMAMAMTMAMTMTTAMIIHSAYYFSFFTKRIVLQLVHIRSALPGQTLDVTYTLIVRKLSALKY